MKFTVKEAIEKALDELKPIGCSLKKENEEFLKQEDLNPYFHVNDDKLFYAKSWCEEFTDFVYSKYGQYISPHLSMEEIRGLFRKSDEYLLKAFQRLYPVTDELIGRVFDYIDWTFILNEIYIPSYSINSNEYNEKFKASIIDKINILTNTKEKIKSAIITGDIELIKDRYINTQSMINWTENNNLSLKVPEFIREREAQIPKKEEFNPKNKSTWALLCIALLHKFSIKKDVFLKKPESFKEYQINEKSLVSLISKVTKETYEKEMDDETIKTMLDDMRKAFHKKSKKHYMPIDNWK
jgi:hypothetical protein